MYHQIYLVLLMLNILLHLTTKCIFAYVSSGMFANLSKRNFIGSMYGTIFRNYNALA